MNIIIYFLFMIKKYWIFIDYILFIFITMIRGSYYGNIFPRTAFGRCPSILVLDFSIRYSWFSITFIEYIQTRFSGEFMFWIFLNLFEFEFEIENEYHYWFSIYYILFIFITMIRGSYYDNIFPRTAEGRCPSILVFDSSIRYSWFSIIFIEYIQTWFSGQFMFWVFLCLNLNLNLNLKLK